MVQYKWEPVVVYQNELKFRQSSDWTFHHGFSFHEAGVHLDDLDVLLGFFWVDEFAILFVGPEVDISFVVKFVIGIIGKELTAFEGYYDILVSLCL